MTTHRNGTQARRAFGSGLDNPPGDLKTAADLAPKAGEAEPEAAAPRAVAFEVSAIFDGWPIVLRDALPVEKIPTYLKRLEKRGFARPAAPPRLSPNGEPECPKHRVFMTAHEKQGDTWFSHKVTDAQGRECYCKGRPGGDSPGWSAEAAP